MKTKKATPDTKTALAKGAPTEPIQASCAEVVSLIEQARNRAYRAVNTELVGLYWRIGKYISRKLDAAGWGEGVVDHLAQHLKRTLPGLRGFTRRNLFRMRQFFDVYAGDEKVSSLLTQLPWALRKGRKRLTVPARPAYTCSHWG
jgi:hypothetical protein